MNYIPDKELADMIEVMKWEVSSEASMIRRKEAVKAFKAVRSQKMKAKAIKVKRKLIKDRGKCETCGIGYKPILQIHHIVPISEYGNNQSDNVICVCPNCHKTIHHLYSFLMSKEEIDFEKIKAEYGSATAVEFANILLRYITKKGEIYGYFESVGLIPTSEE